jgi:hypothetical protein
MTLHKRVVAALLVAIIVTASSMLPADAATKEKRYRPDTTSLDGRTTGWPRTCGHDHFVYSTSGGPVGPYCH